MQRDLHDLSLDELTHDMPRSPWESRQLPPEQIVLSLQVLMQMSEAQPLLAVCVAMTQRAYELYRAEDQDEPELRSDDPFS